ncbi:MAG TPA: RIP metalloprotease RseP [Gemmatimonadaceae bacterium]|nr:RIP metalloprotease RseP [Gemmatimonadaceae bacterium]
MLEVLRSLLAIVVVFGIVIFVHELGHFLAAKAVGVYAPRFSIGFGPRLWSRKWGETEYIIAALPLGGYVRMASREDESMALIEGGGEHPAPGMVDTDDDAPKPRWYDPDAMAPFGPKAVPENRWFESKSLPARLFIMIAGVSMNMLLGFVVLAGLTLSMGESVILTRVVGVVHELAGAPQLTRSIAPGDTIVAVDGSPVGSWNDVLAQIDTGHGDAVTITTQRGAPVSIPISGERGSAGGVTRDQLAYAIQPYFAPVIDEVLPGSPAAHSGLEGGDSVVTANGKAVTSWAQLVNIIEGSPGRALTLTVSRGDALETVTVTPDSLPQPNPITGRNEIVGKIGAQARAAADRKPVSVGTAISAGWNETWAIAGAVVGYVQQLFTGQISISKLNGPVSIGRASVTAAKQGLDSVLYLIAILSVNLAVFNLLPIPILDGGQIAVNLVEAVKGGSLSARTREYLLRFGLAAIALLFVIVLYNDIASLVRSLLGL